MVFDWFKRRAAPAAEPASPADQAEPASPEPSQIAKQASQTAVEAPSQAAPLAAPAPLEPELAAGGGWIRTPSTGRARPTPDSRPSNRPSRNPAQPLQPLSWPQNARALFPRSSLPNPPSPPAPSQTRNLRPVCRSWSRRRRRVSNASPSCRPQNSCQTRLNPGPPNPALLFPAPGQPPPPERKPPNSSWAASMPSSAGRPRCWPPRGAASIRCRLRRSTG